MSAIYGYVRKADSAGGFRGNGSLPEWLKSNPAYQVNAHFDRNAVFYVTDECGSRKSAPQMFTADGTLVLFFGHLINRHEIHQKAGAQGLLMDVPDVRLVAMAYQKWGDNCNDHLDGEYSFAVWNGATGKLILSTDHLGSRSLYYYDTAEAFIFSSRIDHIHRATGRSFSVNEHILIKHLLKQNYSSETYHPDIFRIPAASQLVIERGKLVLKKYWQLEARGKFKFSRREDWYACLRELTTTAILARVGKGKTGLLLSGGLDSGLIAAVLAHTLKQKNETLYGFSSVLTHDKVHDEKPFIAQLLAAHPNISVQYDSAEGLSPISNIRSSVEMTEQFPAPIHYMLSRLIQNAGHHGVDVLYSGIGGDQWISAQGNRVIFNLTQTGHFASALQLLRQMKHFSKRSWPSLIKHELLVHLDLYSFYREHVRREKYPKTHYVLPAVAVNFPYKKYSSWVEKNLDGINTGNIGRILQVVSQSCANNDMIASFPFYDKNLLEFLADIPPQLYLWGGYGRSLFRNAFSEILPEPLLWRQTKTPLIPDQHFRVAADLSQLQAIILNLSQLGEVKNILDHRKIANDLELATATSDRDILLDLAYLGTTLAGMELVRNG